MKAIKVFLLLLAVSVSAGVDVKQFKQDSDKSFWRDKLSIYELSGAKMFKVPDSIMTKFLEAPEDCLPADPVEGGPVRQATKRQITTDKLGVERGFLWYIPIDYISRNGDSFTIHPIRVWQIYEYNPKKK